MPDQENEIQSLEQQFPSVSGSAFARARERALESGHSVFQSENGVIYEVWPNGNRRVVKEIDPPTRAVAGTKFVIP
jgi:hypothetical protein